jgi:hypothetical protein
VGDIENLQVGYHIGSHISCPQGPLIPELN